MLKVVTLNDIDEMSWNKFVFNHPDGNYCQVASWHRIIRETYGHSGYFLAAVKVEPSKTNEKINIAGVLPLIHLKHFLFGNNLISMPFLDLGGILADDSVAEQVLFDSALGIYERIGAKKLEFRQAKEFHNKEQIKTGITRNYHFKKYSLDDLHLQVKQNKVRMILEVPDNSKQLMKSFKSKLRSQIKKPIKEGLICKVGGQELLEDFFIVFSENMKELGSPVHSKKLMKNILVEFKDFANIFAVYKNKIPLAASFTIGFKKILSNPWASSLRSYARLAPNMLLYWAMLNHSCENGYHFFDFGRSTPDENTFKFKKQWGASPTPLPWYTIDRSKTYNTNFSLEGARKIAEKIWMKLPLPVTKYIGPLIRKNIAL